MTTDTVNSYPTAAITAGNAPGRASLVVTVIIVAVGVAQQVTVQLIPLILRAEGLDTSAVGAIFAVFGAVVGVLAIVGLILGILGLTRSSAPRAAAGAGTAIAASALLTVVLGFVLPLLLGALY